MTCWSPAQAAVERVEGVDSSKIRSPLLRRLPGVARRMGRRRGAGCSCSSTWCASCFLVLLTAADVRAHRQLSVAEQAEEESPSVLTRAPHGRRFDLRRTRPACRHSGGHPLLVGCRRPTSGFGQPRLQPSQRRRLAIEVIGGRAAWGRVVAVRVYDRALSLRGRGGSGERANPGERPAGLRRGNGEHSRRSRTSLRSWPLAA